MVRYVAARQRTQYVYWRVWCTLSLDLPTYGAPAYLRMVQPLLTLRTLHIQDFPDVGGMSLGQKPMKTCLNMNEIEPSREYIPSVPLDPQILYILNTLWLETDLLINVFTQLCASSVYSTIATLSK